MNLFVIVHNYRPRYLVVVGDSDVNIYQHETFMFKEPLISLRTEKIFVGKFRLCRMIEESWAIDDSGHDRNTLLLNTTNQECGFSE